MRALFAIGVLPACFGLLALRVAYALFALCRLRVLFVVLVVVGCSPVVP